MTDAIVSAAALLIVALVTFALNERAKRAAEWRNKKLEYYAKFFDSLAVNLEGYSDDKTQSAFARETNNMNLVASSKVLHALHVYRAHISIANANRDYSQDSALLAHLLRSMRQDLKMPGADELTDDMVRLWTPGPRAK